jgi:hypothetical protein
MLRIAARDLPATVMSHSPSGLLAALLIRRRTPRRQA